MRAGQNPIGTVGRNVSDFSANVNHGVAYVDGQAAGQFVLALSGGGIPFAGDASARVRVDKLSWPKGAAFPSAQGSVAVAAAAATPTQGRFRISKTLGVATSASAGSVEVAASAKLESNGSYSFTDVKIEGTAGATSIDVTKNATNALRLLR
jgi:hypothetical protein